MKITVKTILEKKGREKITALTAYDFPFARILDEVGIDIILVGDSLGMVILGYESTLPVTVRDMIHHTKAVRRGVKRALVVTDMPFGSSDTVERALRSSRRFIQEGGAEAVKIEGGNESIAKKIKTLVQAGIPVMGHIGMTPQTATMLGGYKLQGKQPKEAQKIFEEALRLQDAGIFSLVLECVPAPLAEKITKKISAPTIGIGAGPKIDGQILVLHDLLGFSAPFHPRFVRRYAEFEKEAKSAFTHFIQDVHSGNFPNAKETFS